MKQNKMGIENKEIYIPDQVYVSVQQTVATVYHVHIDEEIGEPAYYRNLYSILENACELDTIVFHLNTIGGQVDTTLPIFNKIAQTEAQTIAVIESTVCSAGTFFIMACDSVIAMPHSCVMIHPAAYGYGGDMKKIKSFVEFHDKRLKAMTDELYEGFLTKEEIDNMIKNSEEIWLTAEEVIDRLNNRENSIKEAILVSDATKIDEIILNSTKKPTKRKKKQNKEN